MRRKTLNGVPKYIVNPDWDEAAALYEDFRSNSMNSIQDVESTFPEKYGKKLAEGGQWVMVMTPPGTKFQIPPFSIWFAQNWPMEMDERGRGRKGPLPKRARILTPCGDLGVFPHEYSVVEDASAYLGREKEGILLHMMNGQPAVNQEHLHYLMSRGIRRQDALLMLIHTIKDPTFLWFELAPKYGQTFGRPWPSPEACPFCSTADRFVTA